MVKPFAFSEDALGKEVAPLALPYGSLSGAYFVLLIEEYILRR